MRDLVSAAGMTIGDHIDYGTFGTISLETNTASTGRTYLYSGLPQDRDTLIVYAKYRAEQVSTGQWMQEDPLGFGANDANLRRYVDNDPTNATDPNGLDKQVLVDPGHDGPPIPMRGNGELYVGTSIYGAEQPFTDAEVASLTSDWCYLYEGLYSACADLLYLQYQVTALGLNGQFLWEGNLPDARSKWVAASVGKYFSNSGGIKGNQLNQIVNVFKDVWAGMQTSVTVYNGGSSFGGTKGAVKNFLWGSYIYLYSKFFESDKPGSGSARQQKYLFHEFTHYFGGTKDYGYIVPGQTQLEYSPTDGGEGYIKLSASELRNNADTYAAYLYTYYLLRGARGGHKMAEQINRAD